MFIINISFMKFSMLVWLEQPSCCVNDALNRAFHGSTLGRVDLQLIPIEGCLHNTIFN